MAKSCPISTSFIIISVFISHFTLSIGLTVGLYPSSIRDFASLVNFSYNCSSPFSIAARGQGHSLRGQAMLNNHSCRGGIRVTMNPILGSYVDVGDGQLWIDVLQATLKHEWLQSPRHPHGPQISNVYEMDVITGIITNPHLFFAVLGGLDQFGIITRARIALELGPKRVKWTHMLYDEFLEFSRDQEHLISINGLDYLEGSLFDHAKYISSLISKNDIIYYLEVVKYYDELTSHMDDEELLKGLNFLIGFVFTKDVPISRFYKLNFNSGVFKDIIPKMNQTIGPLLFCDITGIKIKGYLSRYRIMEDWMNHFSQKWKNFEDRKAQFDPKMILSPRQ
ncbi:hypothetical protein PVL29_009092 [Vitis rotundifolia]|uniref:Cytokinin dehydrogenase 1 FAD/cytokinin binding domain-containing protein n=1 Tax=Vitis rotundifolia TaxID=103349 RepID=A0AA38ZYI5_VITRO|nr:hypothetical protein PVL29_009092 [Vitis rotundifolia]